MRLAAKLAAAACYQAAARTVRLGCRIGKIADALDAYAGRMAAPRKWAKNCSKCRRPFRSSAQPQGPPRHCANPSCSWCADCMAAKKAESRR